MTPALSKALLDPRLWRLEAARRRRQLEDVQRYLRQLEDEFTALSAQVTQFTDEYESRLGNHWAEVETLSAQLHQVLEQLARASGGLQPPPPPQRRRAPLPTLPSSPPWPPEPLDAQPATAPSLKELHRRAAMRLHPDRAQDPIDRDRREALMRDANLAYADEDRATLESLLIAAGESPQRLGGFDVQAHWRWLERCEHLAQGRVRLMRSHLLALRHHPQTVFTEAVERARRAGLDPLEVMATRLQAQATELSRQLYVGQRLRPESDLTHGFLALWQARWGEPASVQPLYHRHLYPNHRATTA